MADLTQTQVWVLRYLAADPNKLPRQLAGHGMAPKISAARALVRKGLVRDGYYTGHYGITDAGVSALAALSQ